MPVMEGSEGFSSMGSAFTASASSAVITPLDTMRSSTVLRRFRQLSG